MPRVAAPRSNTSILWFRKVRQGVLGCRLHQRYQLWRERIAASRHPVHCPPCPAFTLRTAGTGIEMLRKNFGQGNKGLFMRTCACRGSVCTTIRRCTRLVRRVSYFCQCFALTRGFSSLRASASTACSSCWRLSETLTPGAMRSCHLPVCAIWAGWRSAQPDALPAVRSLQARNSKLILLRGKPQEALPAFWREHGVTTLVFER